jgi:hypothetical protein
MRGMRRGLHLISGGAVGRHAGRVGGAKRLA